MLIDARKAKGKNQDDVARDVAVHRSTVSKWERGESTPEPHQRPKLAESLGITVEELNAMLSSLPTMANETPEWLSTYLGMEQSATELHAHEPRAIYGLLQTPNYTEAVVRTVGITGASDTYIKRSVDQRLYRQRRVRNGDLILDVIQPEFALHLQMGDAATMAEQLETMAELAELPNVTVRISPYSAGQYEALRLGDFVIMSHPWGTARVHIEGYGGGRFITDADEVNYFVAAFDRAAKQVALSPTESLGFIREHAERWRRTDV